VTAGGSPLFHALISGLRERTGIGCVLNTSFNLRGEPIVSSPSDALKTFFASGIDCLALEDILVEKEAAPPSHEMRANGIEAGAAGR
jgi:carbamoyltransferase